jgi:glycosyltransferase involved in cell wall biosynthesis
MFNVILLENYILSTPNTASVKEVAYVSTFPPKQCGIATFTSDLINSISQLKKLKAQRVISIDGVRLSKSVDESSEFKISRDFVEDYLLMADYINHSSVNVVNIQHEFGIFGGESGEHICAFMDKLERPIATTLHTVLPNFESKTKEVFNKIIDRSTAIVVLNETTRQLVKQYGIPSKKIKLIPHGCPDLKMVPSDKIKPDLGLKNRVVLSTFGLLSKGKGIEHVIQALPEIIKKESRIIYNIIGVTHPQVKKTEGENYRKTLLKMAKNLGVIEHIKFHNRFLSKPELYNYLQATDIYITPYPSPNQVSSGTLSYALAAGKAVVSTPYLHAKEALDEGRGLLCNFNDSSSIAEKVTEIIENKSLRRSLEQNAYNYSRKFIWPLVAKKYIALFNELTKQVVKEKNSLCFNLSERKTASSPFSNFKDKNIYSL